MGSMTFFWQSPPFELHLTQEGREIKKATWWEEDDDIYASRNEETGGTLFGCSKRGRVSCLSFGNGSADLLPVMFLKGKMTPEEFAKELQTNANLCSGLSFHLVQLVVVDIRSKFMFYISKKSPTSYIDEIKDVHPGCYSIDEDGLRNYVDDTSDEEDESSTLPTQPLSMKELAEMLKKDVPINTKKFGSTEVAVKTRGK